MNEDKIIAQALKAELQSDLLTYDKLPQYKAPHRLDHRISKLIRSGTVTETHKQHRPVPFKRRLLIAAIIVLVMAIVTGGITVITRNLGLFTVKQYDIFSLLSFSDTEDTPDVLTEYYRLEPDDPRLTQNILDDYEFTQSMSYSDKENGKLLYFSQSIKSMYQSVRLNTENAVTYPELIKLDNGKNAVYFETYDHQKVLIWEMGDSMIEIVATGFSKNELIELSKFVKKVEN